MLDDLNELQLQAVTAANGPILITAGPGTGKTKTLTARIVHMLASGIPADDIAALTFTNKAAREMRERAHAGVQDNTALPMINTFHALARKLLRETGDDRRLMTEAERLELLAGLPRPQALRRISARELSQKVSHFRSAVTPPEESELISFAQQYETALQEQQLQDFDGLLQALHRLQEQGTIRTFPYVLVDEFQDTSDLQYAILRGLVRDANLFAIGDPQQSIYGFRGAGSDMFARFREDNPGACSITLTINYRSAKPIVAIGNAVIPGSPQLVAASLADGRGQAVRTLNEYSEAAYVLQRVEQGIGGSDMLKAHGDQQVQQPRDYAVLYRTHRAARAVQRAFSEAGIPYQVVGEGSPYMRPDLQMIISGMRYISRGRSGTVPKREALSEQQVRSLLAMVRWDETMHVPDLASDIATVFGIAQDDGLRQLRNTLVQFGRGTAGLVAALQYLDDMSETVFYDPAVNAVSLLTIHAAKGLEFEHVFLIAAEEGVLPRLTGSQETDMDEERRLFYVAVTRAKTELTILHAQFRNGKSAQNSRFVEAMPFAVLPRIDDPDLAEAQRRHKKRSLKQAQGSLF